MGEISLEALVKKAQDLEMLPQTAQRVLELVNQESTTADRLAEVIEKDASITTRLLKIANSAFYGLRREVTTVQHAIMILGYKSVRSLVVATSSKALHKRFGVTEKLLWEHSVGTAIIGRLLAKNFSLQASELSFVGGLLHNVGKAIMNNECPKEYAGVMAEVYSEGKDSFEIEKERFSFSYPEVGCRVIEKWGLPENVVRVIRYHRLSTLNEKEISFLSETEELRVALACVELAYEVCRSWGVGFNEPQDVDLSQLKALDFLKWEPESLQQKLEEARTLYEAEKGILAEAS
jgi:HD-like signal output (HDOD) protein